MLLPELASERIRWGLALLLPVLALALIGLLTPRLLFPVTLVLMFCAIFSGLLQILSQFSAGISCPELPLASQAEALIQPGVALLVFAMARRWWLARR